MQVLEFGVREFLNIALKEGGLSAGLFSSARASAGLAAHEGATARRPEGYQREVTIRFSFSWEGLHLALRGRIDGMRREGETLIVEEIKSTYLPLESLRAEHPYHLAQLRLYHYFAAQTYPDARIVPVLTYVHPLTLEERAFPMDWTVEESQEFFERLAIAFLQGERERRKWRSVRNASLRDLAFPFTELRAGQAELLTAVEEVIKGHRDLLVEAATGIGKTMGVLYPAVRLLAKRRGYHRVFYLTAKTAGAEVARQAVGLLRAQGARLRVLYLQAKERMCPLAGPDRPECDAETCPYAEEFYTKAKRLMPELLAAEEVSAERIIQLGERETICPFELALEYALEVDLIVCDYNYVFDPAVVLRRFFGANMPRDHLFIVDEAHNLVTRGREMYSGTLLREDLREILLEYGPWRADLAAGVRAVLGQFARWGEDLAFEGGSVLRLERLPGDLRGQVERVLEQLGALLATMRPGAQRVALLKRYFDLIRFGRILELMTPEYACYVGATADTMRLRLFCPHPGPHLQQCVEQSVATLYVSATLSPPRYFQALLGARDACRHLALPSPFPREHRLYLHVPDVSTKYLKREVTRPTVAQVILQTVRARPGNYLVFFPSYDYLGTVWAEIMLTRPADIAVHVQRPGMNPEEQQAFLQRVCMAGERANLGMAVMGGQFGEAVDLPGEQLIGTILIGPGLPGLSPEGELIREYFDEPNGEGYYYAYIVPGMIRVIQAAGRVFRTPDDRGVVLLLDDRFLEEPYRSLLPADWGAADPEFSCQDYPAELAAFWATAPRAETQE